MGMSQNTHIVTCNRWKAFIPMKGDCKKVVRLIRRKWQAKAKHDWLKAMKQ